MNNAYLIYNMCNLVTFNIICKCEVRLMTFPPKFFDVLKTNNYYLCRGVAIGETVRLYESSRVSFYFHNVYLAARGVPCIFISENKESKCITTCIDCYIESEFLKSQSTSKQLSKWQQSGLSFIITCTVYVTPFVEPGSTFCWVGWKGFHPCMIDIKQSSACSITVKWARVSVQFMYIKSIF